MSRLPETALIVMIAIALPLASAEAAPTAGACQKAVVKESASYARSMAQMVDRCLVKLSADVVQGGATVAAAAERHASYCAAAFARLATTGDAKEIGTKFDTRVGQKCDPLAWDATLGAANVGEYCASFGGDGSVDGFAEWRSCLRAAADAEAREGIATRWPRALEYFAALRPAMDALPTTTAVVAARSALGALDAAIEGPHEDDQPDPRLGPRGLIATGQETIDLNTEYCPEDFCPGLPDQDGRVRMGHPARLRDNGDGTISDEVSGLTWEKLGNDGSIHERSAAFSFADAINVKIAALNASGFAGHSDWRMPNRRELESLVDASRQAPVIRPLFADACPSGCSILACSCTVPDVHWTSTSYQPDASARWVVDFQTGEVAPTTRELAHVRAVRGGVRVAAATAPGTGSGSGTGSGTGAASLASCQKAVARESDKYVRGVVTTVGKCLDQVSTQVVKGGATVPAAARAAASSCVAALRKVENGERPDAELGARFAARVAAKCDPAVNPKLPHLDADTWTIGARTLSAARLGAYCAELGGNGTIDGFGDWRDCVRRAADAAARQAIALRWPRALEYFAALGGELAAPPASPEKSDAHAALVVLDGQIEGKIDDDRPDPLPEPATGLLQTGQTECAQPDLTMGPCPGGLPGQDGALRAGVARSFTDNGDGTITDHATGLTWEKLSDDDSIHDKDHIYSLYGAYLNKVARLNRHNFAGHDDWRLPNRRELESLVDAGRSSPAIDPIFDQSCTPGCSELECSCTQSVGDEGRGRYASSTLTNVTDHSWSVGFDDGRVVPANGYLVRAVRGGRSAFPPYVNQPPVALDIDVKFPWKSDCNPVTLMGTDPDSHFLFTRFDTLPANGFLTEFIATIPALYPEEMYWGPFDQQDAPMGGDVALSRKTYCYVTFSPTFTGTDSFTYHVLDSQGLSSGVATATLTVFELP